MNLNVNNVKLQRKVQFQNMDTEVKFFKVIINTVYI